MLQKGIGAYKAKYKKFPKGLEELVANNYVNLPEGFTDGFTITVNPYDGSFKVVEKR
jgi:hypothetical protein